MRVQSKKAPWVLVAGGFHRDGGMDKANLALAEYLLEQEHPVHIVGHRVDSRLERQPLATLHLVNRPGGVFALGEPMLDRRGRSVARKVLASWPEARVVVNGGNCIWPAINWVHCVHHAWHPRTDGAPWWYRVKSAITSNWARSRERSAIQAARLVITNSHTTRRQVLDHLRVDEHRVHTVYLGCDPAWGTIEPDEKIASRRALGLDIERPVAVFLGALGLDNNKGFDVLFEAWRRLCAAPDWDVDLLVAGSGKALPMWNARVAEAGLAARIRLLGFTDEVKRILAAADLLVSPVRYESYGLNVQEAICRGIPALISASAGIAERYPSELSAMLLPEPENISDLVARLRRWRVGMHTWRSAFQPFGAQLRAHTWRGMAEEMVSLIDRFRENAESRAPLCVSSEPVGRS